MGFVRDDIEKLSLTLGEPGWLLDRRLEAWGYFEKLELPREKDEPWRYTDLRRLRFRLEDFAPLDTPGEADEGLTLAGPDPALAARGVVLTSLSAALGSHADLV